MATTILQHPTKLILSRQPAVFRLSSSITVLPLRLKLSVTGIGGDSIQADTSHQAQFELSDYLQGLIASRGKTTDWPELYDDIPLTVTFTPDEIYGTPPTSHEGDHTGLYFLLDGLIPKSRRKQLYCAYSSLLDFLQSGKHCLTWWSYSEPKKVLPEQKEFLNYLQVQSSVPVNLCLKVVLVLNDGSYTDMGQVFNTIEFVGQFSTVYFPTGYAQLGIEDWVTTNHPGKMVTEYHVAVFSGLVNYSQVYRYILDRDYYEHPRQLYIKNPFGLWEVILCTGQGSQENEIKPETAMSDGIFYPEKLNWKTTKTDTVKVNTGFLSAAQMQWITDLLDTTEACELIGTQLQPIIFTDIKIPVLHDGEYQYSADLEYEYAYKQVVEQG